VLLGRGDGTLRGAHAYRADADGSIASFAAGRLSAGGTPFAVAGSQEGVNTPSGAISVLVGRGTGGFMAAKTSRTGLLIPDKLALADVNHDGKADLLVANTADVEDYGNGGQNHAAVVVSLGSGSGTFSRLAEYDFGAFGPSDFKVADFNADGAPDLLFASVEGLFLLLGNGDGSFQPPDQFDPAHQVGGTQAAVGDFNGDGRLDVAAAGEASDSMSIFLNQGGAVR
jgi:hypothetical protein